MPKITAWQYRIDHNRKKGECTYCGKPVPKPRIKWCSDECFDEFNWPVARGKAIRRDKGICQRCGCDTFMMERVMSRVCFGCRDTGWSSARWFAKQLAKIGFPSHYAEVHHIVAVSEGGTNRQENLITLCVPCHKIENAEQAKRWANNKKGQGLLF